MQDSHDHNVIGGDTKVYSVRKSAQQSAPHFRFDDRELLRIFSHAVEQSVESFYEPPT